MNQIQMVMYEAYLAADPEMRYTPSGQGVTNFRMASNRTYKNAEGTEVKETTWLKVTCWGKLGEIINQYCAKGSWVVVTGRLRPGPNGSPAVYQLKTSEAWASSYELTAERVRILKGKDNFIGEGSAEVSESTSVADDSELPF